MTPMYASEIAAQGLNLAPMGMPHQGPETVCAMCARPILPGDISAKLVTSQNFTDWLSLTPSEHVCGFCEVTTVQANMRPLQRAVITPEGIYPIGKDDNRAWFLLTPPEPPYVVVVSNRQASATFHLHWKTPVTLSNDLGLVRADEQLMRIRRPVLLQAIEDCAAVSALMHERIADGKKKRSKAASTAARHPFTALDRSLSDVRHGRIRADALEAAAGLPALKRLQSLSQGELWALATLVKANAPTPIKPDLITSPTQSKEA